MNHLILVLGCHRSGTSLIAKSLECLGVSLGPNADWSGPDNPTGFQEDRDALAINDGILRHVGSRWDDPTPLDPYAFWPADLRGAVDRIIRNFLEIHRFPQYPTFGLKEPRLCRLLPVWRRALAQIDCEVSVIHVLRHPSAVAQSLEQRNGIPVEQGFALWLEYVRRARIDVDPEWPSIAVCYDDFIADPVLYLSHIGKRLGLRLDESKFATFLDDFIDHGLRHHHPNGRALPDAVAWEWALSEKRTAE